MSLPIPINLTVRLDKLFEYELLKSKMEQARTRFYHVHNASMLLAASYLDELPEGKTIVRLRREIRLATRGTPQTIAEEAITSAGYVSAGTEQLYNAQSHLVKTAWRMIAPLVHPDRGGDTELYQLCLAAYRLKDLTFLQETYLALVKMKDVVWRSSEGVEYMKQELLRPEVTLQRLRQDPTFQIAMLHQQGKSKDHVVEFARAHARTLILMLQVELNNLLNPNVTEHHDGNSKESEGQGHVGETQSQV